MRFLFFRLAAFARNLRNPRGLNEAPYRIYTIRMTAEPQQVVERISTPIHRSFILISFFFRLIRRQNCCTDENRLPNQCSLGMDKMRGFLQERYHDNKSNHNQKCPLFVSNKVTSKLVEDYQS